MTRPLDRLIVGSGPAGLSGAIYLGRFRRRVPDLDEGNGRCAWIPVSHNHPGFPDGIAGMALLARMRTQAAVAATAVHNVLRERGTGG